MSFTGALADRVAVQELNASYGDAVSRHDIDQFAALWSEDAKWFHPQMGQLTGRAAIIASCQKALDAHPMLVFMSAMGQLEVLGEEATGCVYVSELVTDANGDTFRVTGRYDDQYVKQGTTWLFRDRRYHIFHRG